ncbi:MAG TPA: hypothetical protein VK175_00735 [Leadbetterella sp.]|nr:hypothetical protein [Leadbetterella sp.]
MENMLTNIYLEKDLDVSDEISLRYKNWNEEEIIEAEISVDTIENLVMNFWKDFFKQKGIDLNDATYEQTPNISFILNKKILNALLNQSEECQGIKILVGKDDQDNVKLMAIPVNKEIYDLFQVEPRSKKVCTIMTECPPNRQCPPTTTRTIVNSLKDNFNKLLNR